MNEIRVLMEKTLGLYEGRGVAARTRGDTYINDEGHVLSFERVIFVPDDVDNVTATDIVNKINDWKISNTDIEIKEVNKADKKTTAAVIVVFKDGETNSLVAFIKYLEKFPTNRIESWKNSDFKKFTGYEYTSKLSKKEKSGIKASDILATSFGEGKKSVTLSPDTFIETVRNSVKNSSKLPDDIKIDILNLIDNFINDTAGQPVKLVNESMASAYSDYLGEILAPYSITKIMKVEGDIQSSQEKLLAPFGYKYSDLNIRMSVLSTERLIDSTLTSVDEKIKIGISSKSKATGGAAASIANLYKALEETDDEWKRKNPYAVDIVTSIKNNTHHFNPLELGRISGLITKEEYPIYKDYIIKQSKTSADIPLPKLPSVEMFMNSIKVKETSMTKKYFILQSGIAKMSANIINENAKFNITQSFLELLNKSSILQVYTVVKIDKKGMRFEKFDVKYPPQFKGKVKLRTDTRFKTTGISGKVGFMLV